MKISTAGFAHPTYNWRQSGHMLQKQQVGNLGGKANLPKYGEQNIRQLHLNIRTFKYTNRYLRLPPGRFSLARPVI